MRLTIDLGRNPQSLVYTDSMNAAIVAGLVAAGLTSEQLVGEGALPWTFAMAGRASRGHGRRILRLTLSSPAAAFAEALERLDPSEIRVASSNGDRIDCSGGVRHSGRGPARGTDCLAVTFGSPVALMRASGEREKRKWADSLEDIDLDAALRTSLTRRAGRDLDLSVSVDPLTRIAGTVRQLVKLRKMPNGRPAIIPAFTFPLTLRGAPEDIRFAFLAGLGAKTRAGFGCPILLN